MPVAERLRGLACLAVMVAALLLLARAPAWAGPPRASRAEPVDAVQRRDAQDELRALRGVHAASPDRSERRALVWTPASVAYPVAPGQPFEEFADAAALLEPREPGEPLPIASVRGSIEIDRTRAALVWIEALETIRVRRLAGAAELRFWRLADGHAASVESGIARTRDSWELFQPPGVGALWLVALAEAGPEADPEVADASTTIVIERAKARSARFVDVEVEREQLDWIADGGRGEAPPLLRGRGDALAGRLALLGALADALLAAPDADAALRSGVEAWWMLATLLELDRERELVRPYFAVDRRELPLRGTRELALRDVDSRRYRAAAAGQRWVLDLRGSGRLSIAARSIGAPGSATELEPDDAEAASFALAPAELRVWSQGRLVARVDLSPRAARRSPDPDTVLPTFERMTTSDARLVGELAQLELSLPPGAHEYELELIGGDALVWARGARRIERVAMRARGWTPARLLARADKQLARSSSDAARWARALLDDAQHGALALSLDELDALARTQPALALALAGVVARERGRSPAQLRELVERVLPWFEQLDRQLDFDPDARGWLRAQWLELAAIHGDVALARRLVRGGREQAIVELPVGGLRELAELLGTADDVRRSSALALLELARRRNPVDEDLRRQYLRVWRTQSRWSRRRPVSRSDELLEPLGSWVLPRHALVAQREDPEPEPNAWLRIDPGVPVRVRADRVSSQPLGPTQARQRLFDLHVSTPEGAREPLRITLDDRAWTSPMLQPVQRHRFAVPFGEHTLRLDAPPGTLAWVELPPADTLDQPLDRVGRREHLWQLDQVAWLLPGPATLGFVRLELRWLIDQPAEPLLLRMHQDGGSETRTLVYDPRERDGSVYLDDEAMPVGETSPVSLPTRYVLPIAAESTRVWFEVESLARPGVVVPVAAALSLRRAPRPGDDPSLDSELELLDPTPAHERELFELPEGEDALLAEIAGLSRVLLLDPNDLPARARRSAALLALGETGHARADLVWLTAQSEREDAGPEQRRRAEQLREAVQHYFEALFEPREVAVGDAALADQLRLLEPALTAFVGDDAPRLVGGLELWAAGRSLNPDDALALLDVAGGELEPWLRELTRAHWLVAAGRNAEAGRLWTRLYGLTPGRPGQPRSGLALGLAAVEPLLRRLDEPDPEGLAGIPGVAHGLARELERVHGHPLVRRLAFVAALRSEWTALEHSENNAGFERLELPTAEQRVGVATRVREALLVTPWPSEEAELLVPGRKAVVSWDARPGNLQLSLWCRAARPDLAPTRLDAHAGARLELDLRAEGEPSSHVQVLEVHDAQTLALELPIARKARHRLEVALGEDPLWQCSLRTAIGTATSSSPIETLRRATWWTAGPNRGVELVVLGPTALQIESRAVVVPEPEPEAPDARAPAALRVEVTPLRAAEPELPARPPVESGSLPLARVVEQAIITEQRRRFSVGEASESLVLLTEPGPHRVRITSERGRALVRVRMRRDRPEQPPPARVSLLELAPAEVPPAKLDMRLPVPMPEPVEIHAIDRLSLLRNHIGSFDANLVVGLDDLSGVDDLRPRFGSSLRLGWRRSLIPRRLWLAIAGDLLVRERSGVAGGGLVRLSSFVPRAGLRVGAELHALAQPYHGRTAASVQASAFVDRPTMLGRWLQLRPGLSFAYRWQSLRPASIVERGVEAHPLVYTRYVHDHPLVLRPELGLRAFPLQDLVAFFETALTPNSNFASLDTFDMELGVEGNAREPRAWLPLYRFGYQSSLRFADPDRSAFYVRHRLEASIGAGVWLRDVALLSFGVRDRLYVTQRDEALLRNVIELWLRVDAVFGRRLIDQGQRERWFREGLAPRAWADEPDQAESTTLDRQPRR